MLAGASACVLIGVNARLPAARRMLLVDLGAFVLVNVYVPNAGPRGAGTARRDLKTRFLRALKRKCDGLADAGREVRAPGTP
jgi:exonuclease III